VTTSVKPTTAKPSERLAPPAVKPERRTPKRVMLQRRAPETLRRHVIRGFTGVAILLAGDALAFLALRSAIRAEKVRRLAPRWRSGRGRRCRWASWVAGSLGRRCCWA